MNGPGRILRDTLYSMKHFMRQLSLWSMRNHPFLLKRPWKMCFIDALGRSLLFSSPDQEQGERKQVNPGNVPSSSFAQYWIQFGYCPSSSLDGFRVKWVLKRISSLDSFLNFYTWYSMLGCLEWLSGGMKKMIRSFVLPNYNLAN